MVAFLNPNLLITIFAAQPDLESEISLIRFAKLRSQTPPNKERPQKPDHDDNRSREISNQGIFRTATLWFEMPLRCLPPRLVIYKVLAIHSNPVLWK